MNCDLLFELDRNKIAWITFNRPKSRNATNVEMLEALHARLLQVEADSSIRCVVFRGAGEHFMAGADLGTLETASRLPPRDRRAAMQQRLAKSAPIFTLIERLPQPVLASVRGSVAGGGVGFMLACDLVIAANDTKIILAQVKVGLSPDGGTTWHLPRAIGMKRAKQLALLGESLDATTALAWGLVNWIVEPDRVQAETERIANQLAAGASRSLTQAKQLLNRAPDHGLADQVALETQGLGLCAETEDFVEGLRAVRQKRVPKFFSAEPGETN